MDHRAPRPPGVLLPDNPPDYRQRHGHVRALPGGQPRGSQPRYDPVHVHRAHGRARRARSDARARRGWRKLQRRRRGPRRRDELGAGLDQRTSAERRTPRQGGTASAWVEWRAGPRGELVHPRRGAPGVRQGQSRHLPLAAEHPGRSSKNRRRAEVRRRRRRRSQDPHAQLHALRRRRRSRHPLEVRGERHVRAREGGERSGRRRPILRDGRRVAGSSFGTVRKRAPAVSAQHVLAPRGTRGDGGYAQRGDARHHRRGGRARHRRFAPAAADDGGGGESAGLDEHPRGFLSASAVLLSRRDVRGVRGEGTRDAGDVAAARERVRLPRVLARRRDLGVAQPRAGVLRDLDLVFHL